MLFLLCSILFLLMKIKYIKCWNAKIDENTYAWNFENYKKTQKVGGSNKKSHESSKYSIEGMFTI